MNDYGGSLKNRVNGLQDRPLALAAYAASCGLLFVLLFHHLFREMWDRWKLEDFNYCYFVPLIVLYLLWEKRAKLRSVPAEPSWAGIAPLLSGFALFWMGKLTGNFYSIFIGFWFVTIGCIWIAAGWRWLRTALFPLFCMLFMFPVPSVINFKLNLQLKLFSSSLAVKFLQLSGMSVHREGNVIDLGGILLQVVDACSGLRYFYPLVVLSVLMAYHFRGSFWKKALLILTTVPISVISNAMRIASTAILCRFWGEEFALGFIHDFSGWFIFMLCLGLLLLEMRLLKMALPEPVQVKPSPSAVPPPAVFPGFKVLLPQSIVVTLLLVTNVVLSHGIDFRQHKTPMQRSLDGFPLQVSDWRGAAVEMDTLTRDALKYDDYVMIHYTDRQGKDIELYTVYYGSQGKGGGVHLPADCFPANGWTFAESGDVVVPLGKKKGELRVRRALAEKDGERELIYFWFPQRGRDLTRVFQLNYYLFLDAFTRQRTDGAMVRIITPLYASERTTDAEARLQGFAKEITSVLEQFLPR